MFAEEPDNGGYVRLPVLGPAFEIGEDGRDTRFDEQSDCVFEIFVEVGIEDALVHEVKTGADIAASRARRAR